MRVLGCISLSVALLGGSTVAHAETAQALVNRAQRDGLPAEALQNKIHEGQAKGVSEARIAAVVSQLAKHLRSERVWLDKRAKRGKRSRPIHKGLWIAVAEARMAGVDSGTLRDVALRTDSAKAATRRVDALVDLRLRGYKGRGAAALVKRVKVKDLRGLGRSVERVRAERGLSRNEVLDGLVRGLGRGRHLRDAVQGLGPGSGQGAQHRYRRGQGGGSAPGRFGPGPGGPGGR